MAIRPSDWFALADLLGNKIRVANPNMVRTPVEGCNDDVWTFYPPSLPEKREGWRDPPTPLPPQGGGRGGSGRSGDYA